MTNGHSPLYEFGHFRIDFGERLLLRNGEVVPLPPKAFDTLVLLVRNSGRALDKSALMKELWPDTFVEEANLAQHISLLRKALGESPTDRYIETVPRRGYRFLAKVVEIQNGADPPSAPPGSPLSSPYRFVGRALSALAIFALGCVASFLFLSTRVSEPASY